MANDKETKDNSRVAEMSRSLAKHRKRLAPNAPSGPAANSRRIPLAQALETKLSQVADESGRTYSEIIADKLVSDALRGKLPALVLSKLVVALDSRRDEQSLHQTFANKTTEELRYFVMHGRWPGEELEDISPQMDADEH